MWSKIYFLKDKIRNFNKPKEFAKTEKCEGHTNIQWATAILANFVFLTYGLQAGWPSPMTKVLKSENSPIGRPLTDNEVAWVGSLPSLAGMFGVSVLTYISDRFGRKAGVQATAMFQLVCWLLKICPSTIETLLIARFLSGIAGGGAFSVVPLYVKEISQDNIRGILGVLIVVTQYLGVFTIYTLGTVLEYYTVLWIAVGLPALTILLMVRAPESPAFLIKTGKVDKAAETIALLRGLEKSNEIVENEIKGIQREDEYFKSIPNISFLGIFRVKVWRKGFLILLGIIFGHAQNGAFTIITYASTILQDSGVTVSAELQTLSFPIFMLLASFFSMALVERLGRRMILAAAFLLSTFTDIGIGSVLLVQTMGIHVPGWITVIMIIGVVCLYAVGVASLPFVIMSEIFNFQVRAKLMCCLITSSWFLSFIQLLTYAPIVNSFGSYCVFYGYSITNFIGFLFCVVMLPETKGKSVEEIEKELERK